MNLIGLPRPLLLKAWHNDPFELSHIPHRWPFHSRFLNVNTVPGNSIERQDENDKITGVIVSIEL